MYKKERNRPFATREEVLAYHKREKIPCLECGKLLIFLPSHIWFVHGIRADEYRVKWNIPKHIALAGISYLEKQSEYMKARIAKGKLDPAEQIAMMRIKGRQLKSDPDWRNRSGSILKKQYARRDILKNRVWERSPSIKSVSVELKTEAIRRMKNRKVVGEKVQDIADDLTSPGNEDARQEAEQDAIDRDELDRRQAGHVGQDDEQEHEDHGNTAKRRNIRRQPRNIMAHSQLP